MTRTGSPPPTTASRSGGGDASSDETVLGGRYRLDEEIGRGGMAVVHRGTDLVLERDVAVKVFRSNGDAADAARYEHEARILASLNQAGLVTVYDAGVDASDSVLQPFLVMEYVDGATLADVLGDGPMQSTEVARLGAEIATALAYAHRHGVVHRDVKPANILLPVPEDGAPEGRLDAKLTDFGIARLVDGGRITTTNRRLGTVAYLSPEQVRGTGVGPASDVYSLGLVLAECLTGAPVFPGDGVEAAAARLHEPPALPPTLSQDWGRVLRDMLDLEPERRPTAAEVSVALTGLMMAAPTLAAAPTPDLANAPSAHGETAVVPAIDGLAAAAGDVPASAPQSVDDDPGPNATKVLEIPHELLASRRTSRPPVPYKWLVAAAVALVAFLVLAGITGSIHTPAYAKPPAYPSVPGKLGTDLVKLQQQVRQ